MPFTFEPYYVCNPVHWPGSRNSDSDDDEDDESVDTTEDTTALLRFSQTVARLRKESSQDPLILAVLNNDINSLMKLSETTELNKFKHPKTGDTLLHIAVTCGRKKAFHYILSISDFPLDQRNNKGDTALNVCLEQLWVVHDHFACELIKKGCSADSVPLHYKETLLHRAIAKNFINLAKLLMEMGYDVNAPNRDGITPLWLCFNDIFDKKMRTEVMTALLYYGADPNLEHSIRWNLFEFAVLYDSFPIQEALFHYMIDDYTLIDVNFHILLLLARRRSPLFRGTLQHSRNVNVDKACESCFPYLFAIDVDDLDALIKKCPDAIREVLPDIRPLERGQFYQKRFLENLNRLVESDLRDDTISFIRHLNHDFLYLNFLREFPVGHSVPLEHLCFLSSYGLTLQSSKLTLFYGKFGFGEMLKMLLHMEIEPDYLNSCLTNPHLIILFEINFDLKTFLEKFEQCNPIFLSKLLHYFADAKLRALCSSDQTPKDVAAIIAKQPDVPLLVELARNAFRKYFIRTFKIKSAGQFYKLVTKLPVPSEHKKIITFERQLY